MHGKRIIAWKMRRGAKGILVLTAQNYEMVLIVCVDKFFLAVFLNMPHLGN